MKQKDIALIIVIAFISAVVSFLISDKVFVTSSNKQQTAPVVDSLNSDFTPPSSKYFNSKSIDPTQVVPIGNSNNTNPFHGSNGQ